MKTLISENDLRKIVKEAAIKVLKEYDETEMEVSPIVSKLQKLIKMSGLYGFKQIDGETFEARTENVNVTISLDEDSIPYISSFNGNFYTSDPSHEDYDLMPLVKLFNNLNKYAYSDI